MNGAIAERVDGEASRVAEQVQDIASSGIFPHESPVLPLVQEEAGFLPFRPIDKELMMLRWEF